MTGPITKDTSINALVVPLEDSDTDSQDGDYEPEEGEDVNEGDTTDDDDEEDGQQSDN